MPRPEPTPTERLWLALTEPSRVRRIAAVLALGFLALLAIDTLLSHGLVNSQGEHFGGDFIAFHTAGQFVLRGEALAAWDATAFETALRAKEPAIEFYGLTWQYPPAMYFLVTPFATLPVKLGYWLWMGLGLTAFYGAFRLAWGERVPPLLLLASPIVLVTLVQGQATLFLGGLMVLAAALPDRRPVLAGVAAGLLTVKPQLGLLIPVAWLFAGHWRAFGAAAATSLVLAGVATLVFGPESWSAFADSLTRVGNDMAGGGTLYPPTRSISPYGFASALGISHEIALALQGLAIVALAAVVAKVWAGNHSARIKAAVLIPATLMCSPYAYYYDLVPVLFTLTVILSAGQRALSAPERVWMLAAFPLVLYLPMLQSLAPIQIGFLLTISLLMLCLARLRSASAAVPAPAH